MRWSVVYKGDAGFAIDIPKVSKVNHKVECQGNGREVYMPKQKVEVLAMVPMSES
jgi:hypothetical protein